MSTARCARRQAAQPAWDALGGERARGLLDRAADLFEEQRERVLLAVHARGRQDLGRRGARSARGGRFPALSTRPRRGGSSRRRLSLPGPTGELNQLRLHGRGVFACISPWNFPLAIFTGPVAAALAAGNAAIAKPAEQTPLIGALAVELMHEAGIPKRHRPARAGRRQGRRGADRASAGRRRRLHRLDRDRAGDQPQPRRARRADHPVDRRDRRAECDDRRFSSALPEQVTRDVVASSLPERRPALLGAARAVRPGRRRRRDAGDDRRARCRRWPSATRATSRPTSAR